MFQRNMGGSDRAVRFILGVLLVISAAVGALGTWAYIGVVAILGVAASATGQPDTEPAGCRATVAISGSRNIASSVCGPVSMP